MVVLMTQMPFSQPQQRPSQQSGQPYRQLRRSQTDRKIGGVCGGIGEYFGIDPTLVRIALIVATVLTGGAILVAYVIAMVVIPDQPAPAPVWHQATAPTPTDAQPRG
jgi:phage shock protein C